MLKAKNKGTKEKQKNDISHLFCKCYVKNALAS